MDKDTNFHLTKSGIIVSIKDERQVIVSKNLDEEMLRLEVFVGDCIGRALYFQNISCQNHPQKNVKGRNYRDKSF